MQRPAPIEVTFDTSTVTAAGTVAELWDGRSTIAFDSRFPNGVGGTHMGVGHPTILVVPQHTRRRSLVLDE